MRVLNPTTRNPFYKMFHRINGTIGGAGTFLATGMVTMGGPAVAGVVSTPTLFFAGLTAIPAYFGLAKYNGEVKENTRLNTVYDLRKKVHQDYYPEVDAVIADIFGCNETHKKYEAKYGNDLGAYLKRKSDEDYRYDSMGARAKKEYTEKWEKNHEADVAMVLGAGCEYCGKRIRAIQELVRVSTTESTREIDDARLNNLIEVISAKTMGTKALDDFMNSSDVQAEIRNSVRKELTK